MAGAKNANYSSAPEPKEVEHGGNLIADPTFICLPMLLIWVSIFPEGAEVLIGSAGFGRVFLLRELAGEPRWARFRVTRRIWSVRFDEGV